MSDFFNHLEEDAPIKMRMDADGVLRLVEPEIIVDEAQFNALADLAMAVGKRADLSHNDWNELVWEKYQVLMEVIPEHE